MSITTTFRAARKPGVDLHAGLTEVRETPALPAVGALVDTMCVGHLVQARVLKTNPETGEITGALVFADPKRTKLFLNYRDNWLVEAGYQWKFSQTQLDRAKIYRAMGHLPA